MRRLVIGFSALACSVCPASLLAQDDARYDVSYLWSADRTQVFERKDAVGRILGPRVERHLRVAQVDEGYVLVYLRRGDEERARMAAAAHTRLLNRRGLGEAVAVPSQHWVEVLEDGAVAEPDPQSANAAEAVQAAEKRRIEELIGEYVKELRRQGRLASDERTAWSVYDFTTSEKLVEINADLSLQAASLIKPFVALAFFHEAARGRQRYDDEARRQLERMIQHSNNRATNWAMKTLGGPAAVQRLLKGHYGEILESVDIVEYIPSGGRTYRNKASAGDYSRFLLALWKDELPGSAEIKRLMALPKRDRISTGARDVPEDTEVYSKTGSTRHLCGDMGVLQAKGADGRQYAYTLIGIIEKRRPARNYNRWLRARGNIIREISSLVYRGISQMHGLQAAAAIP
ncbi:MAG: serine hydrolase [Elusimicrobiota bacterium]